MAPSSLEVTGQVQTHPRKPLLPLWSWLPGQWACSGIQAAVLGGRGARGANFPSWANFRRSSWRGPACLLLRPPSAFG